MSLVAIIMLLSICFQFVSVGMSTRMAWIVGKKHPWLIISLAMLLMLIRRMIMFYRLVFEGAAAGRTTYSEMLALIIWVLMTLGIYYISSIFRAMQRSHIEREKLLSDIAEKNEEMQHVIHVISHDLRAPLVSIEGFTGVMDKSCKEIVGVLKDEIDEERWASLERQLNEDVHGSLDYIKTSTKKMGRLLEGLLKLSRIGRSEITIERINMDVMVRDIVESIEYQVIESKAEVVVHDLPECMGDSQQLNQVFSNLIDNALKYLDPNRKGKIDIRGRKDGGKVIYSVQDNGVGIAEKDYDTIFQIFKRVEDKHGVAGEGLGLALIQRIMLRMNGKVWLNSKEGEGTTFFVALPMSGRFADSR